MGMLLTISAVVLLLAGLFAWRYEAATGGTGGIAKLIHDRLVLARLRYSKSAKRETSGS
jgi:hypothetical protein